MAVYANLKYIVVYVTIVFAIEKNVFDMMCNGCVCSPKILHRGFVSSNLIGQESLGTQTQ